MNIIFDLDGTILNSKVRLYRLFQDLVPSSNFTYDEYWRYKRSQTSHEELLASVFNYDETEIAKFNVSWLGLIESDAYLQFDKLYENVENTLRQLAESNSIYLCTARQFREPVFSQLSYFGVKKYFTEIFVTDQKITKETLLKNSSILFKDIDCFVGDTGHDILTGRSLGLNTFAITHGFLSRESLLKYKPNHIVRDIFDLNESLTNLERYI